MNKSGFIQDQILRELHQEPTYHQLLHSIKPNFNFKPQQFKWLDEKFEIKEIPKVVVDYDYW